MKTIYVLKCLTQFWNKNEKIIENAVCAFENQKEAEEICKRWNRENKNENIYHIKKYKIEEMKLFLTMK